MTTARIALPFAVAFTVLPAPCKAQTVQGILVSEKTRQPIGNARVLLVDSLGRVASEAVTDTGLAGAFYLTAEVPGRYEVRILVGRGGLSFSPRFSLDSNQVVEKTFVAPDWPKEILEAYLPDDVAKPVALLRDMPRPRYPDRLRARRRAGVAHVRFVVDSEGRPVIPTFQVIESDDQMFSQAVLTCVTQSRFAPAERDGVPVPQIFDFTVDFGFGDAPPKISVKNGVIVRALGVIRWSP
ncbi:MAG TPA: TonB family protein [Gemmatimonadaceae bacterium]